MSLNNDGLALALDSAVLHQDERDGLGWSACRFKGLLCVVSKTHFIQQRRRDVQNWLANSGWYWVFWVELIYRAAFPKIEL